MTAQDSKLLPLRSSLVVLGLAIAVTVVIGIVGQRMIMAEEATHRQLAAQQRDIRGRISRAREEEAEIRDRIARYNHLREAGVIGVEERLDWVEQIARIKTRRRLIDLQYELSPQKPMDETLLPGGPVAGSHEFMVSTMRLRMPLLHEDDLLGLLDDLRLAVHAHLLVRDCIIERATPVAGEQVLQAQLRADCTIDWVTIREKRS